MTNPRRPRVSARNVIPSASAQRALRRPHLRLRGGGRDGLVIVDVERPEAMQALSATGNAGGKLRDARDVVVASTNASLFAYVADGEDGLKVLQLTSPESQPKFYGFSPEPKPQLIARLPDRQPGAQPVARARARPRGRRDGRPDRGVRPDRLAAVQPGGDAPDVPRSRPASPGSSTTRWRRQDDGRGPWWRGPLVPLSFRRRAPTGGPAAACAQTAEHRPLHAPGRRRPAPAASATARSPRSRDATLGLDEYRTWSQEDAHARAYRLLEEPRSKRIAAQLGIGNPTSAKVCLDCHADNVPQDKRGPKFQLSDGVSCEACHGGRRELGRDPRRAVGDPPGEPGRRHVSQRAPAAAGASSACPATSARRTSSRPTSSWRAGHPRLSFELEAYTTNQPAHFTVDADYRQRKGKIDGMNLWLTGQLESARATWQLLQSDRCRPGGHVPRAGALRLPQLPPRDGSASLDPQRAGAGIKPGTLRLQTQNLVVLQAVAGRFDAAARRAQLVGADERPGQAPARSDVGAVQGGRWRAAGLAEGAGVFGRRQFSARRSGPAPAAAAVRGQRRLGDYAVAEQIVLGVESLSYALGDRNAKKAALDKPVRRGEERDQLQSGWIRGGGEGGSGSVLKRPASAPFEGAPPPAVDQEGGEGA